MTELTVHPTLADEEIPLKGDDEEVIATLRVRVAEVDDVRHMLITAMNVVDRNKIDYLKQVLTAQVDMIAQGLHVRDHDFPDLLGDVNAFHAKFGLEYTGKPRMLPQDLHEFRCEFHREETEEYRDERIELEDAVRRQDRRDILTSLEKQLDGLVDSVWVLLGTADLQFGRKAFFEAWKRVARANMAKIRKEIAVEGEHQDSGRAPKFDVVKPAGWQAPDHRDLVEDNAVFDELFGQALVKQEPEYIPTAQDGYSDTRSV